MPDSDVVRLLAIAALATATVGGGIAIATRLFRSPSLDITAQVATYQRQHTLTVSIRNRRRRAVELRDVRLMFDRYDGVSLGSPHAATTGLPCLLRGRETLDLRYPFSDVLRELARHPHHPVSAIGCALSPGGLVTSPIEPALAAELSEQVTQMQGAAPPLTSTDRLTLEDVVVEISTVTSAGDAETLVERASRITGVARDGALEVRELLLVCEALSAEGGPVQRIAESIATRALGSAQSERRP